MLVIHFASNPIHVEVDVGEDAGHVLLAAVFSAKADDSYDLIKFFVFVHQRPARVTFAGVFIEIAAGAKLTLP